MQEQPRVLFVIDMPNWAFDFKSTNLIKHLQDRFNCRKVTVDAITAGDIENADIIILFYWPARWQLKQHNDLLAQKVVCCGISGTVDIEKNSDGAFYYLGLCDAVFVHNRMLYEEFKDRFDKPFYFNPNGVDTGFFWPTEKQSSGGALIAGWAGSLTNHGPMRGYEDIILPAISQTPGVELRVAAREDKWRSHEEMRDFYQSLDVYLVGSRVEGTPNPALEAASCGVPIIATRVGNMPELIRDGENGFLIDRTPEAMAAGLARLRDNRALLSGMRQRIRQDILPWDWSLRAQNYAQMISESLARKR